MARQLWLLCPLTAICPKHTQDHAGVGLLPTVRRTWQRCAFLQWCTFCTAIIRPVCCHHFVTCGSSKLWCFSCLYITASRRSTAPFVSHCCRPKWRESLLTLFCQICSAVCEQLLPWLPPLLTAISLLSQTVQALPDHHCNCQARIAAFHTEVHNCCCRHCNTSLAKTDRPCAAHVHVNAADSGVVNGGSGCSRKFMTEFTTLRTFLWY